MQAGVYIRSGRSDGQQEAELQRWRGEARDGGACRVGPSDTSSPPRQPPVLCCLAASDVWVCREVPEWALEIGHSLPVLPALTPV